MLAICLKCGNIIYYQGKDRPCPKCGNTVFELRREENGKKEDKV